MEGSRVESLSERLGDLVLKKFHVIAGVRANNLSRNNGDSSDLVRGETLNTNRRFRGGLLATLRNPTRSSLAGRNNNLLPRRAKRHLTGELHHGRCVTGLLEIVLSLCGLNEPAKGASGSCGSLCHYFLLSRIPRAGG